MTKYLIAYLVIGIFIDAVMRPSRSVTHLAFFWFPLGLKLLFVFLLEITRIRKLFRRKSRILNDQTYL